MKLFDDAGLYNNIYVELPGGFSSLAGLTQEQAVAQFGQTIVNDALRKHTRHKTTKYNIIKAVQAQGLGNDIEAFFIRYPLIRQEWDAAPYEIFSDNENVRLVLEAIGANVDAAMSI